MCFSPVVRIVISEMSFIKTRDDDETANLIWNDSAVQHEKIAELRNYQVSCEAAVSSGVSHRIWIWDLIWWISHQNLVYLQYIFYLYSIYIWITILSWLCAGLVYKNLYWDLDKMIKENIYILYILKITTWYLYTHIYKNHIKYTHIYKNHIIYTHITYIVNMCIYLYIFVCWAVVTFHGK